MKKTENHLPLFGIGPILCFPFGVVTAVAIILSAKGVIPGRITNDLLNRILFVLGILLIIEGIIMFLGADFKGTLKSNITENTLKTNGSYSFVRNPCYSIYFLGGTGAILIAHNWILFLLPFIFWIEMTIVLKKTEEKWLKNLYGQDYDIYCRNVNRCIPWIPRRKKNDSN